MAEEQKKPRTRGKDRKPRKTAGYQKSSPANLEKARENSPIVQGHNPDLPEGYNSRMIQFTMEIMPSEKLDYNDIEEMERRFKHYLETCAKYDMKIGNQAAYAAIGIDKGIAWEWVNRCTTNPARTDFIKKVQKVCALYREGLMQDGKVNPVTGIFWQKNYDGMKDQTEMVLTPNNPLGDSADTEALARKYLDNADIVDVPEGEISEVAEGAENPKIK